MLFDVTGKKFEIWFVLSIEGSIENNFEIRKSDNKLLKQTFAHIEESKLDVML